MVSVLSLWIQQWKLSFQNLICSCQSSRTDDSCEIIDPYHSAVMLSLGGIKSFVFAQQASARREFNARLTVQKRGFLFS